MFNKESRYITRGANEKLDLRLQLIIWSMIDKLNEEGNELDYLQVFKIRRNKNELIIEHTQEVPEYKKVYLFNNLGSLIEEDLKIFIIDENDYNIMLLAEEYWLKGGGKEGMVQVLNGKEKK